MTRFWLRMTSYFQVTTIDASNFLESEYPSCELMQYKEEVLSLLEQELSYRGDYFIFSELSGWSANVRKERILDDKYFYEMSVIKLIEDFGPFRIVSYVIMTSLSLDDVIGHLIILESKFLDSKFFKNQRVELGMILVNSAGGLKWLGTQAF